MDGTLSYETAFPTTEPRSVQTQDENDPHSSALVTPQWVIIGQAFALALITVVSGFLNAVVVYTIHKRSYLQTPSNRFIYSMAIANAVTTLLVLPFNLVACVQREWVFGVVWCNLMGFVTLCSLTGSLFSIALITLDRYYAIVQPMMYPLKATSNYTVHLIVGMWFLALLCTLPPSFGWSRYSFTPAKLACMVDWYHHKSFSGFFAIVTTLPPFALIGFCYIGILQVARRSSRRVSHGIVVVEEAIKVMSRRRSRRTSLLVNIRMNSPTKALRTVLITVGAVVLTWVPFVVELVYETVLGGELIADWLEMGSMYLIYCSLIINPCIYALWNKTVRNEILGLFCARSLSLQWAWRDDDNILAKRRESRRLSISGSVSDQSYLATLRSKMNVNSTQITGTGQGTSSNDSVSIAPLASIHEQIPSSDVPRSSRKAKRMQLSARPAKTRVTTLQAESRSSTTETRSVAQLNEENNDHRTHRMVTRSQKSLREGIGEGSVKEGDNFGSGVIVL